MKITIVEYAFLNEKNILVVLKNGDIIIDVIIDYDEFGIMTEKYFILWEDIESVNLFKWSKKLKQKVKVAEKATFTFLYNKNIRLYINNNEKNKL